MQPIWNMGFILILALIALIESKTYFKAESDKFMVIVMLVLVLLVVAYWLKMKKYNKDHPNQQISSYSFRPAEYLEEDEGMTYITRKAAQKVYSYFSVALPVLTVIAITTSLPRLFIIWGILAVALGQYWIYYREIRKHLKEETE